MQSFIAENTSAVTDAVENDEIKDALAKMKQAEEISSLIDAASAASQPQISDASSSLLVGNSGKSQVMQALLDPAKQVIN